MRCRPLRQHHAVGRACAAGPLPGDEEVGRDLRADEPEAVGCGVKLNLLDEALQGVIAPLDIADCVGGHDGMISQDEGERILLGSRKQDMMKRIDTEVCFTPCCIRPDADVLRDVCDMEVKRGE